MKRRDFVQRLGIGSTVVAAGAALGRSHGVPLVSAQGHDHEQVNGPQASATVSFGQWIASAAIDRIADPNPRLQNQHLLIPYMPTIKAGGSVNFVIAGFHHVLVYAPGTQTGDIDTTVRVDPAVVPSPRPPNFELIADRTNRVYRGLDPSLLPQDRVEVVTLREPGTYLVICGFVPHFVADNMHGFVRVIP